MLAHISTSFWSTPRNAGMSLCQLEQSRAEQSRAEVMQSSSLFARRTVTPTNGPASSPLNECAEQQGHTMLKKETYIPSLSLHDREMGGKDVCISHFELAFFNIEAILYIDNPRARHLSLRDSSNTSARMFVASPKHTI